MQKIRKLSNGNKLKTQTQNNGETRPKIKK